MGESSLFRCGWRESNPHGLWPPASEAGAYPDSATSAGWVVVREPRRSRLPPKRPVVAARAVRSRVAPCGGSRARRPWPAAAPAWGGRVVRCDRDADSNRTDAARDSQGRSSGGITEPRRPATIVWTGLPGIGTRASEVGARRASVHHRPLFRASGRPGSNGPPRGGVPVLFRLSYVRVTRGASGRNRTHTSAVQRARACR